MENIFYYPLAFFHTLSCDVFTENTARMAGRQKLINQTNATLTIA